MTGSSDRHSAQTGLTGAGVVSSGHEHVGEVTGHLWTDASGFDVVSVGVEDDEVALPIRLHHRSGRGGVTVPFSTEDVRQAPRTEDLAAVGGEEAVRLIEEYYGVALSGPPPGPGTTRLPPWWKQGSDSESTEEPDQDESET